jgi:hypothetical protein
LLLLLAANKPLHFAPVGTVHSQHHRGNHEGVKQSIKKKAKGNPTTSDRRKLEKK